MAEPNPYQPLNISPDLQLIFPNNNGIWGLYSKSADKFVPIPMNKQVLSGLILALIRLYEIAFPGEPAPGK